MSGKCCKISFNKFILLAAGVAGITALWPHPITYSIAESISDIFMNLLKLVSVPIIFLSLLSTVTGMELSEFRSLGLRVVKYTIFTTFAAALVALILFLGINPVQGVIAPQEVQSPIDASLTTTYFSYLFKVVPSNIIAPFSESNVISVLLLALLLGIASLTLPDVQRHTLHNLFSSLYALVMKVTSWIVICIPLAIWSFITLAIRDMSGNAEIKSLGLYLCCVIFANLVQAVVVLPLFLKFQGVSTGKLLRGMWPALSVAFFTKSSSATLPMAMRCAQERVGISDKLSNITFPLCTTLNMNGCAAFILITVLFVSMSHGIGYSLPEMALWTVIATIAALGNAGVPMGCYFLSTALLASMNVPLYLMGLILPFYALIDMLETAVNVWSDSCVVAVVHHQISSESLSAEHAAPSLLKNPSLEVQ
jgi:Na+/H+-dicarboxylate symporter